MAETFYDKKHDTWSMDELLDLTEQLMEDNKHRLSRARSPKSKRQAKSTLGFYTSITGRLRELETLKSDEQ